MNNVMTLTGLFLAGLCLTERRLLVEDTTEGNAFGYDCCYDAILNQVFDLDSAERDEWIDLIINQGAIPSISMVTGSASIAL